jgi:hypothetical protein
MPDDDNRQEIIEGELLKSFNQSSPSDLPPSGLEGVTASRPG